MSRLELFGHESRMSFSDLSKCVLVLGMILENPLILFCFNCPMNRVAGFRS